MSLRAPAMVLAFAIAWLVGGIAPQTRGADASVSIVDFEFEPADVTITAGDSVTWTVTRAQDPHTVTPFDPPTGFVGSGLLRQGDTFSVPFPQPGTYRYLCSIHPEQMRGTVTVLPTTPSATVTVTTTPSASQSATPTVSPSPSPTTTPTATPAQAPSVEQGGPSTAVLVAIALIGLAVVALLVRGSLQRRGRS